MGSSDSLHPERALSDVASLPQLPACEHFAGSERFIKKALRLRQESGLRFDITCDCEDGAASGREEEQLEMILDVLKAEEFCGESVGIRVHERTHPLFQTQIERILSELGGRVQYITVPKIVDLDDARRAIASIHAVSGSAATTPCAVHLLIETHGALRDVAKIAKLKGVATLDFGLMDFVSAHGGALGRVCMRSPDQFEHRIVARAKSELVAAALAAGVIPSHNVTIELEDSEQAFADAHRARREFGFLRMWSVHPHQIEPILRAMGVDRTELQFAINVLLRAQANSWGPLRVGSELFDRASYRYLWDVLRQADAEGLDLGDAARSAFFT